MSIPQEVKDVLNQQTARIVDLQQQVSAMQYILSQTLVAALKYHQEQNGVLQDFQVSFAEQALASGITADSGNAGFELAEQIFTSVKASL